METYFYPDIKVFLSNVSSILKENDFIVIDDAMPSEVLSAARNTLMLSTVWFDTGNGVAYFAHAYEGLVFPLFQELGLVCVSFEYNTPMYNCP